MNALYPCRPITASATLQPGSPRTAGRDLDRRGRQFRRVLQWCGAASSCACSMRAASTSWRGSRCRSAPRTSGTASCRRRTACPVSSTGCACTGRTIRCMACATTRNKLLLDPYARCAGRQVRVESGAARRYVRATGRGAAPTPPTARRTTTRRASSMVPSTGATTVRRPCPGATRVIYEAARQGIHQAASARARARARHVPRPRASRRHRSSEAARRHGGRAAAGAGVRAGEIPRRQRARELLGLQLARVVRAGAAVRDRRCGRRVQDHGQGAARRRHRSDSRRRVQSHRRRQRDRADAEPARPRQCGVLQARADEPAPLRQSHRHRQHDRDRPRGRAQPGHRLHALLGRGNARRWLPLRSGRRARARQRPLPHRRARSSRRSPPSRRCAT